MYSKGRGSALLHIQDCLWIANEGGGGLSGCRNWQEMDGWMEVEQNSPINL